MESRKLRISTIRSSPPSSSKGRITTAPGCLTTSRTTWVPLLARNETCSRSNLAPTWIVVRVRVGLPFGASGLFGSLTPPS